MKKIYLSLIAIIFAMSLSAQTHIYMTYQSVGASWNLTHYFQAHISDSNLANTMTYQWTIEGVNYTGQSVSHWFTTAGTHIVYLSGTGQGLTYNDIDTLIVMGLPCLGIEILPIVTNASTVNSLDGAVDITIVGGTPPYFTPGININNMHFGWYEYWVVDSFNCTDSFFFFVDVDTLSYPCNINLSANITNTSWSGASDGFIDLSIATNMTNYDIYWLHNGRFLNGTYIPTSEDIYGLDSGYYTVVVQDSLFPPSCFAAETYYVGLDTNPPLPCNLQSTYTLTYPTAPSAQDGAIDITMHNGNPPLYYYWSDGINNYYTEDLNQIDSGTYTVSVVDQDSCTYTETFFLYPDSLSTIATYSYYIDTCLNQIASASIISYSVNANNEITVVWEFVEVGTGNTSTITVTYLSNTAFLNGRYQFVLSINCNGAKSIVTDTYSYYLDVGTTLDEYSNNNLYKIYPNPAKETISISLSSNTIENTNIYIYNSLGMIVYSKEININSGINTYQIPLINIKKGVYFININGKTQSFIKE